MLFFMLYISVQFIQYLTENTEVHILVAPCSRIGAQLWLCTTEAYMLFSEYCYRSAAYVITISVLLFVDSIDQHY